MTSCNLKLFKTAVTILHLVANPARDHSIANLTKISLIFLNVDLIPSHKILISSPNLAILC